MTTARTPHELVPDCTSYAVEDVVRQCPGVNRGTIRLVMGRLRREGRIEALGRGPGAMWRVRGEKS